MNARNFKILENEFYEGKALKDANTITERNQQFPFEFTEKNEVGRFGLMLPQI